MKATICTPSGRMKAMGGSATVGRMMPPRTGRDETVDIKTISMTCAATTRSIPGSLGIKILGDFQHLAATMGSSAAERSCL